MHNDNFTVPTTSTVDKVVGIATPEYTSGGFKYTVTRRYRNMLGYPVSVIDRNNMVVVIPSNNIGSKSNEFVVEMKIGFSKDVNLNLENLYNGEKEPQEITAIKLALKNGEVRTHFDGTEFTIEYIVTGVGFASKGFVAYYEDLDISLAKSGFDHRVVHPYSALGKSLVIQAYQNEGGWNYIVVINDPYNQHGDRFINISNRIYRIRKTVDYTLKPGVYIYVKDECSAVGDYLNSQEMHFYEFSEADEKVPLWSTPAMAKDFGDAFLTRTEEIKSKEMEIKQRTAELSLEKTSMDAEIKAMEHAAKQRTLELEMEIAKLQDQLQREKVERDRIAMEEKYNYERRSQRDKFEYEQRSNQRKDSSEFIKWLPGFLVAVTGVANVIITLMSKKTQSTNK